jgi:tight adherence protein B
MDHLLRRITSEDLDLLVTAINIQHEVGGNMAQILDVIGETIRERVRIKGEISVLTAQGSMSGYIISALPLGLAVFLFVINPGYMTSLFAFPWVCMPIFGAILIVIGFFAMKKIVQIEV